MDNMDHEVKVLSKILNSELFLGKYPMVKRVWVDRKGEDDFDIVFSVNEPADDYWVVRDEIRSFVYSLATMAAVKGYFSIYP